MANPYIFISHSSEDNAPVAEIVDDLQANGIAVWLDIDRLQSGKKWLNQIQNAIDNCAGFLVIVSRKSRRSDWVMRECLYAMQLNKPLFIALIDDVPLPLLLVDRQYNRLVDNYDEEIMRLVDALSKALANPPTKPEPTTFPEIVKVDANEGNFFAYLETMDNGKVYAKTARDLYQWAKTHLSEVTFSGHFRPAMQARQLVDGKAVTIFSLLAYLRHPSVQIPLDYLRKYPPFTVKANRQAIVEQLADLLPNNEGFAPNRVDRRPTIALDYLQGDADKLEQFKAIVAEIVTQLEQ
ncbi:MAG: toll/interleukin-1 receptor domain-containing protein [Chloroflexota bacterium]